MRYTIETAKLLFAENNCELLEDSYTNSSTPMNYKCQCGKTSCIALADFKRGRRCRECGNNKAGKTRQQNWINQDEIKQSFAEAGCQLKSEYLNYNDPLEYICKCGNIGNTTWWSFQLGRRCGHCSDVRKLKYDLAEVKEIFKKGGCELLQDEYVSNLTPVKYKCSCGSESSITLNNFMKGSRCKSCGFDKNIGNKNHRWIKDRKAKHNNDLFRRKCCHMVRTCLKQMCQKKLDRTHNLLGYSYKELRDHIFTHQNWETVKNNKWHIDHIFPIKAFFDHGISDLKLINCLENLQPLTQRDNNVKSDKYNKKEFVEWLQNKGIPL